jgi:hypothetical protein
MFACSFGILLKTFHWSPELLPELGIFNFDRPVTRVTYADNTGEGQKISAQVWPKLKYGTTTFNEAPP